MDTSLELRYSTLAGGSDGNWAAGMSVGTAVDETERRDVRRLQRGSLTLLDVIIMAGLLCLLLAAASAEFRRYEGHTTVPPAAAQPAPESVYN